MLALLAVSAAAADRAPDFELPSLGGEMVKLSEISAQKAVLISFWATWCVPCPEEMKHVQRFYDQYKDAGFDVLAISIDGTKTVSKVKSFVQGRRFSFPVLLDTNNDVKRRYQIKAVPTVYLLRPGGEVVYHHVGYRPGDEVALEKEIKKLMAALQPAAAPATDSANPTSPKDADSNAPATEAQKP
jgi:peroxiredoxin